MSFSALSFGGGVNSTALLLHLVETATPLDLVLFADTGGERPATYAHVEEMAAWSRRHGIRFVTVSNGSPEKGATLEENCLRRRELPSLAYGFKGCSVKWKRQPMDRYIRDCEPLAALTWAAGELVVRYIGIDAGETRRKKLEPDNRYLYRYPLVAAGLDRDGCLALIRRHGIAPPPKSSCFFCPAMTKAEIHALPPDLQQRAMAIEANALTHTVKGLGRRWSWTELLAPTGCALPFAGDDPKPCDCTDEDDD